MGVLDRKVAERAVSGLPISVATSLAIETICGVNPLIPMDVAPVLEYDRLLVNLRTLIRNVHGALETDIGKIVQPNNIIDAVIEELSIIESAIALGSNGKCSVTYYWCSHDNIRRQFPYAFLKVPTTDKQRHYYDLEQAVVRKLGATATSHDVRHYDVDITHHFDENVAILTHHPLDLLSKHRFKKLTLLESHTGALKQPSQWSTKLTDGKELTRIPFNRVTLQIFGDNSQLFTSMPPKTKTATKQLAEDKKWTAVTTMEKVIFDIGRHPDMTYRSSMMLLT
jgi:hypothetical protein